MNPVYMNMPLSENMVAERKAGPVSKTVWVLYVHYNNGLKSFHTFSQKQDAETFLATLKDIYLYELVNTSLDKDKVND